LPTGGDDESPTVISSSCIYIGGDIGQNLVLGKDTLIGAYENPYVAKMCYSGLLAGFSSSNITICSESCIAFYDNSTGTPNSMAMVFSRRIAFFIYPAKSNQYLLYRYRIS